MRALLEKRVVLVTGKGGVGRSTITAALAHLARRAGKRVLVTEPTDGGDAYSPLAHLFGRTQLPREAAEVAPGIGGSQLVPELGAELFLHQVLKVGLLARTAAGFEPLRRLFTAAPSLRELGICFHLLSYLRARLPDGTPRHELVLVDMPATGHTLALTSLPQVVLRLVSRGPVADAMREGQAFLNDPALAGAWVVTLPETLPITEALELVDGLRETAMPVGGLLVNRVPPDDFTAEERGALQEFLSRRPLLGADAFHRAREAQAALERLRGATRVPAVVLPELEATGVELVQRLSEALEFAPLKEVPA